MEKIEIKDGEVGFADIYEAPYFPDRAHAKSANLLILPLYDEDTGYYLTEYADEFACYLRQEKTEGIDFDVAMRDAEYQVVYKHFDLMDIGCFIVKDFLFVLLLNLISSYVYDKFASPNGDKPQVELKLTITSQHADGKTTSFNYEGPVEGLKGAEKIIDKVVGDD